MASIRAQYWPLTCKSAVKGVLRTCIKCFRVKPVGTEYIMGSLPASRVTPARPFHSCEVDYAGPFHTKERTQSRVTIKAYLCIFVCFTTKAVHLELASDLSTDTFINCLHRFIARRGRCHSIYLDNGSNFIGARNELRELGLLLTNKEHINRVTDFLSKEQMQWHLIPPYALKYHLKRVIGQTKLTFEELYTVLTQVESCLNSRPLYPLSNDPTDLNPLTPGHFLIGAAMTALPQPELRKLPENRLNRYQHLQQMFQHFWQCWQSEYLHQLQQRHKWAIAAPNNIQPGTLVVLREDNLPPMKWWLGRITEVHPGSDNVTRVVSVKASDGIFKRPVSKLCILPLEEDFPPTEETQPTPK